MFKKLLYIFLIFISAHVQASMVLTVGDSLADGYGIVLPKWLEGSGWTSINRGVTSSGLISTKPVDWSTKLRFITNEYKPSVIIMSFGANDAGMPIKNNGRQYNFGSDEWAIEYISRVYSAVMLAKSTGAFVIWMPIPEFKDAKREREMAYVRALQDIVIDRTNIFKPDLKHVQNVQFKSKDGVHYNMSGYRAAVDTALRDAWNRTYGQ